jgi:hypothetical protein
MVAIMDAQVADKSPKTREFFIASIKEKLSKSLIYHLNVKPSHLIECIE